MVRKGKRLPSSEEKNVSISPESTEVRREEEEEEEEMEEEMVLQVLWPRFPCHPWRSPQRSRFVLRDCSPQEGCMLEQGKRVRRKCQRGTIKD